jgi:hypothetical protein
MILLLGWCPTKHPASELCESSPSNASDPADAFSPCFLGKQLLRPVAHAAHFERTGGAGLPFSYREIRQLGQRSQSYSRVTNIAAA